MKHWLLGVALVCFGSLASAQVIPLQLSTTTVCVPVVVSSFTTTAGYAATAMIPTKYVVNKAPYLQTYLTIQNLNATAGNEINCNSAPTVSTVSAPSPAATLGWSIPGATSYTFTLQASQQWYCTGGLNSAAITTEACINQ